MNTELIGVALDSLILFFLVAGVYVAFRLSKSLNDFKSYRASLEHVLKDLQTNIERAQTVMRDIKDISQTSGKDIQNLLLDSKTLIEELRLMNQAGDALANRLEKLAGEGRQRLETRLEMPRKSEPSRSTAPSDIDDVLGRLKSRLQEDEGFEQEQASKTQLELDDDEPEIPAFLRQRAERADENIDVPDHLQTQAEQDLYRALQRKKGA